MAAANDSNAAPAPSEAEQANAISVGHAFALLQGGSAEAAAHMARVLVQNNVAGPQPDYILGMALMQLGRVDEAVTALCRATSCAMQEPVYAYTYGGALLSAGNARMALRVFQTALDAGHDYRDTLYFLGIAALESGRWPTAVDAFEKLLRREPSNKRAREALRHAEDQRQRRPNMFRNATRASSAGQLEDAIYWLEQVTAREPTHRSAKWDLAVSYSHNHQLDETVRAFRDFLERFPGDPASETARFNIAWNYGVRMLSEEAVAGYRELLRHECSLDARKQALHEILFFLPQVTGATMLDLRAEAEAFQREFGADRIAARTSHPNKPDPDRKLRIGFASRLFDRWSYSRQILPMLRYNQPESFEIYCYHMSKDPIEPVIGAEPAIWRDVAKVPPEEVADLIAADAIDILIDCNGASARCGFDIFCRKPAPVQIGWSNKGFTSGNPTMDYFVSDEILLEGQDDAFTERLYRLPCYHVPYPILDDAPPVSAAPVTRTGVFTFGSLATPSKFGSECWRAWSRVLTRLPESRFLIKNALADGADFQKYVQGRFAAHGIASERLIFSPGGSHHEFLKGYGEADLMLDTMPMSGGNTIIEALWQGVLTVSKCGQSYISRNALAFFSRVGLEEFVAYDEDQFVELAVATASRPDRLEKFRWELRPRLAESELFDGKAFAGHFHSALRFMWREWCAHKREGRPMRAGPIGS